MCYVGMTRAMKLLYICYTESRRLYGKEDYPRASRFLKEIPGEQLQEIRLRANVSKPVSTVRTAKPVLGTVLVGVINWDNASGMKSLVKVLFYRLLVKALRKECRSILRQQE